MNKLNYVSMPVVIVLILSLLTGCKNKSANVASSENKTQEQAQRPGGGAALKTVFDSEGAKIATAQWSAKLPQAEQETKVQKLLAQGEHINLVTFTLGSVLPESGKGNEHMNSFDYAYKLEGVRNWLFEQKK